MTVHSSHLAPVAISRDGVVSTEPSQEAGRMSREDVRIKLIDAALEILLCNGIQAFTQARVAELAGVRQSHLTYYFPTRSDLLTAVVEYGSQVVLDTLGTTLASLPPTIADFRQAMAKHLSDTRMPRLMMALSVASDEDPTLKVWMTEFDLRMQERMRLALVHYGLSIGANELALFHAMLVGIAMLNLNASTEESSRQAGRLFVIAFDRLVREHTQIPPQTEKRRESVRKTKNV